MKKRKIVSLIAGITLLAGMIISSAAQAQQAVRPQSATLSPEVSADRHVTFHLMAPKAVFVKLDGGDIPGVGQGAAMVKDASGIWSVTLGPIDPGAYRYNFNVDGLAVIDPRNPITSESNSSTWSLFSVSGSDFMDTKDVPHGSVASVYYQSASLNRTRRMHVYTPPGYELGEGKYPVFYLLHGASDSDESWSTVGRAGFILDNLIAAKKAKPMIVVMPCGHTKVFTWGEPLLAKDEFVDDFLKDIKPFVEKNYRTINDREHRALAGLSMGDGKLLISAFLHWISLDILASTVLAFLVLPVMGLAIVPVQVGKSNTRMFWITQNSKRV